MKALAALFFIPITCLCQTKNYSGEFSVLTDNDVFFFRDYYYSAGQELSYRKLLSSNSKFYKRLSKTDTSKVLVLIKGGIKVYTPREISQADIAKMDRPYAGYDYLSFGITKFEKKDKGFSFLMDIGLVGKSSGLGQFQAWWHKVLELRTPRGWYAQIVNEVTFNTHYKYWKSWRLSNKLDLVSTSAINAGTASNKLSQDLNFRILNFNSLKNSNFTGSILSTQKNKSIELFFFGGFGVDYVASNIFIEGSLFKKNSPLVFDAEPFIFRQQLGLMYSTPKWSYSSTMTHLSKEVSGGIDHIYGSIDIGFRF